MIHRRRRGEATRLGKLQHWRNRPASETTSQEASGRGQGAVYSEYQSHNRRHEDAPPPSEATHCATVGVGGEDQASQQQKGEKQRQDWGGGGRATAPAPEILRILYTNIQSIQSKIYELEANVAVLDPDIILLTETWCNQSIPDAALSINNYVLETDLRRDRNNTANGVGGGLLVYAKPGLKILPCDKFNDNEFNQFCYFKIETKGTPLNIVLVYRPPGSNMQNSDQLCNMLKNMDKHTILIGDVNLPEINWLDGTSKSRGRKVLETTLEEDLTQLVNFPTHVKGNTLDLVITNCPDKVISISDEGRVGKSDHCILNIKLEISATKKSVRPTRPNWNKADTLGLKIYLKNIDWLSILEEHGANRAWNIFKDTLDLAVSKFVPVSTVRAAGQPRWLTRELIRLIGRKKRAWKLTRTHGTVENWTKFKNLEKEVIVRIRNAKRKMEKNLANAKETSTKTFANYIKSKSKTVNGVGPLKSGSGTLITDEKEMAETLNKFFASVFTKEDILNIPVLESETDSRLENVVFTSSKIREKINGLKKNSAPGPDGITVNLLQTTREELLRPLLIIYEKTLSTGIVPMDWKEAIVTPIFKKGTRGEAGNYRPVSLTSIPCKIFESILKDNIMTHLEENRLIKDSQHGFMPGRSCATNLVVFQDKLTEIVDQGKSADIFYLDFAKAFDKVPHKRLTQKLKKKGIHGNVLRWIENWLTDRSQSVKVGSEKSDFCAVESGVPQGSVLGPTLFVVFIDDIDDFTPLIELLTKFADDTKGLKIIESPADKDKLQNTLDSLTTWAEQWGMSFNIPKCKIMHVGRKNPRYEYKMAGKALTVVEEEKDIGVTVHSSLKPGKHCQKIAATASAVLRQLTKNFHYRDRHVFKKLYIQYVRPHVEFASPAWSPWTEHDKALLEKVQIRAVNLVAGLQGNTYEDKCKELGLETLEKRRVKQDLLQTYKILHGVDKVEPGKLFTLTGPPAGRITRFTADPMNIVEERSRLEIRKNSYAVRVATEWNKLEPGTKTSSTTVRLKKILTLKNLTGREVEGPR